MRQMKTEATNDKQLNTMTSDPLKQTPIQTRVKEHAESMDSVVSFPQRCNLWGNPKYPGNCDGRLFAALVIRYGARRVADPMEGSGTTRHVVEWLNQKAGTQIEYWGSDLHAGFNLHAHDLPGEYDLVWIHPPYWNIVRYSDNPADLSTCQDYTAFVERLRVCLRRCSAALAPGGRLAVLVGDIRKHGRYFPMVRDVLNLETELGTLASVIIKLQHNCRSDKKTYGKMEEVPIRHEYCVVFRNAGVQRAAA